MKAKTKALLKKSQLLEHVLEWIADGWGLDDPDPTDEQVAAALLMEANTQDACVKAGESVAEYPVSLRKLAFNILQQCHPGYRWIKTRVRNKRTSP